MYSPSTIGEVIRVTTFGESHGKALGVVIDGLKSGIEINEADIQKELDRRKPGQSSVTTSRGEDDKIKILSGVFEGKTTGCPIAMIVENKDMDSSKYDNLKEIFRPGHADFTFFKKFGFRDHRGGGRSSGRETLSRVAAGGIAKKLLEEKGIKIIAYTLSIGDIKIEKIDYDIIEKNPIRTCDIDAAKKMEELIVDLKKKGESIGGMVQLEIKGLPAGIGDPVFAKLDARLGGALLSIGSVKGVEFGLGFEFAKLVGSQSNDFMKDKKFSTNNAGGILGGISSGDDIIIRLVVKPTPSVSLEQDTITKDGQNTKIVIHGRHDPCIIPRIIPVVESMASLVLLDAIAIQEKLL
ncbi:MAG: chorismate synthase [Spirochaetes bacterium GWD1_27_9]|nr:MAG: chorismate synthase [Spirochaetes bacterium GWB1_27_13]OHD26797.1 MAG: chorismate synthase [Spirochaetes bacterium GWC1_27_15]OHD33667.1 MAG: chorismate synthase [Spirochaetes bacterium GWD1_27_9]